MEKDDLKNLEQSLRAISDCLRRCKTARAALAGFCALGPAVSADTITASLAELHAAANQLSQHVSSFHGQVNNLAAAVRNSDSELQEEE